MFQIVNEHIIRVSTFGNSFKNENKYNIKGIFLNKYLVLEIRITNGNHIFSQFLNPDIKCENIRGTEMVCYT